MPLLNYTTQISADKTIGEIQRCLVKAGAQAILNEYGNEGYIERLSFKVNVNGQEVAFRLPCNWEPVYQILQKDWEVPKKLKTQEQALRVTWRIIKDWVEAQMAIVQTKTVKVEQVFLPYAVQQNGKTLYENIVDRGFMLPERTDDN